MADLASLLTNNFQGAPQMQMPGNPVLGSQVMSNNPIMGMIAGQDQQNINDTLMQNFQGNMQAQQSAQMDLAQKQANIPLQDAQRQLAMSSTGVQQGLYDSGLMKQVAESAAGSEYQKNLFSMDQSQLGQHLTKMAGWNEIGSLIDKGADDDTIHQMATAAGIKIPDGPVDRTKASQIAHAAINSLPVAQAVYQAGAASHQQYVQKVGTEAAAQGVGEGQQAGEYTLAAERIKLEGMLAQLQLSKPPDVQTVNRVDAAVRQGQPLSPEDVQQYAAAKLAQIPGEAEKEAGAGKMAVNSFVSGMDNQGRIDYVKKYGIQVPDKWNGDINKAPGVLQDVETKGQQVYRQGQADTILRSTLANAHIMVKNPDGSQRFVGINDLTRDQTAGKNIVPAGGAAVPSPANTAAVNAQQPAAGAPQGAVPVTLKGPGGQVVQALKLPNGQYVRPGAAQPQPQPQPQQAPTQPQSQLNQVVTPPLGT